MRIPMTQRLNKAKKSSPSYLRWEVNANEKGASLGQHIARELLISDDEAEDLIDFGAVHVGGHPERDSTRSLRGSEDIRVYLPWQGPRRFYEVDPQRILYEDSSLLAYNKEAGIPSQQTPSDAYNNLYAALYRHLKRGGNGAPYVALHHRLDRETSGVMVFALDPSVNGRLGSAFQHHKVKKDYLAWVAGEPEADEWVSSEDITRKEGRYRACPKGQGKRAETYFHVLRREEGRTLLLACPRTGRTHQIRLHLEASGYPILGDRLYGKRSTERLRLHAYRLRLPHPVTSAELDLRAPLPAEWPPSDFVVLTD